MIFGVLNHLYARGQIYLVAVLSSYQQIAFGAGD